VSVAVILVLVAPLAGALLAPAFGDYPAQRRLVVGACLAAMLGGAALALVRTVDGSPVAWRGFTFDVWRAVLVAGAVFSSALAVARADEHERAGLVQAALFGGTAALVAPLLLTGAHTLAVALPIGTLGVAVAAFALTGDGPGLLRGGRSVGALAASDVLALVVVGMALSKGTRLPQDLSLVGGFLLLAAAALRLGLAPLASALDDSVEADAGLGLLFNGGVRAQGFLLALMAVGSHRTVAYAAAAVGAFSLLVVAARAAFARSAEAPGASVASTGTAVALIGFALGGTPATWGAVLALAASFAAWPLWSAGVPFASTARASLAALPAGGLLTGSALVVVAAVDASTARPWFLALALPAIAALLSIAAGVWESRDEERAGEPIAGGVVAAIGFATVLALAAVPARAASGLGIPVANLLGSGRLLTTGSAPGIPEDLAAVALAAAVVAFAAGPGRLGRGGAPGRRRIERSRSFLDWWARAASAPSYGSTLARDAATATARRWGAAGALLFAVSVGLALRVYIVAAGRGFL